MKLTIREPAELAQKKRLYAELFAGCGGMSLGIESEGYNRLFANELSPMAAAAYAFTLIHNKQPKSENPEDWDTRLYPPEKSGPFKTNPNHYLAHPITQEAFEKLTRFGGDLFVGGINQINQGLEKPPLQQRKNINLDILSGGPPCQSFSLAGRRDRNNTRYNLQFEFAKCASLLQPKIVLLENVTGILRAFKDTDGKKHYAWLEVAKAFFEHGYIPFMHKRRSKPYGVPER